MTLIQELTTKETAEREAALSTYREVLSRQADPQARDAQKLKAAMTVLGKTSADLENDLRIFQRAARLEQQAGQAVDAELSAATDVAGSDLGNYRAETTRLQREREAEDSRLFGEFRRLQGRQRAGHEASGVLAAFRARHWALLGLPQPELESQPEPRCVSGFYPPVTPEQKQQPKFCAASGIGGVKNIPFIPAADPVDQPA